MKTINELFDLLPTYESILEHKGEGSVSLQLFSDSSYRFVFELGGKTIAIKPGFLSKNRIENWQHTYRFDCDVDFYVNKLNNIDKRIIEQYQEIQT